ncbi:hypothetical protein CO051_03170 [Candidatus Roizmanbacteria bacterium CG_4_9_14_0_2_um_filter_39_13]|uniref:Isopentenyl phosphate kinase n=1 Tax=Candidatus Roizmanbacteria bacterium CG_4_9_14_0_2_um_filter_39_13 TaxID=1974839 RepID=A0A2M8EZN2_9BACT|nr:MAG: hypothetical protein COU64_04350 [Candidatus Pacebacteria bacterium CG10_big_fil_rev_8_21_14_0_10_40_26]PIZ66763.1 MAG: hypothetical protein COY15_00205 [Candidatus Roizmanbacteria bacterium CG_4_10_14_0_2_um_filter_39_12]PJC32487.1 MAG: hypothetical protein CO051_03170 [Candidatus Roizmanbacteria bacterium CG_4_9_14_0_2_um_filter_39_13]
MEIVCIKLGGSLITDKNKPYTARPQIITQLVTELKKAFQDNPNLNLVLGNGAGSFAHQSAQKYDTYNGFSTKEGALGACVVHNDAAKLNSILVEECIKQELPVYSLQPSAMMLANNRSLSDSYWSSLNVLLKKRIIPFVYGDVILDTSTGSTIFSTDTLFRIIGTYLKEQGYTIRMIHVGDYSGVLDKDGQVISQITPDTYDSMKDALTSSESTDVTGGMKLKVEEMIKLAKKGVTSYIIDGTLPGNISIALSSRSVGTQILSTNAS